MILFQQKNTNDKTAKVSLMALMLSISLLFSCSNGQTGITKIEIGEKGKSEAFIGSHLPIKAEINLNEKIKSIEVQIALAKTTDWSLNRSYREKYVGNSKVHFNESFEIPYDAEVGNYELMLKVNGENGAVEEKRTRIQISVDSTVPIVGDLDVGINAKGNDLHLETDITAAKKIKQVSVALKGKEWSKDFVFDKPAIKDHVSYNFHEHVNVNEAPKGEYEVVLTVEDQEGRKASTTNSFQKK